MGPVSEVASLSRATSSPAAHFGNGRSLGSDSAVETPKVDPKRIQQFVVGTGGRNHIRVRKPPLVGEVVRDDTSFGVLSMTLNAGS